MLALVRPQVDPGGGDREELGDGRPERGRVAGEGEDAPVVVLVGLHVEDPHAGCPLHGGNRLLDHLGPAALADVGDALDDLRHGSYYHSPRWPREPRFSLLKARRAFPIMGA
jgi:hypothetical protein